MTIHREGPHGGSIMGRCEGHNLREEKEVDVVISRGPLSEFTQGNISRSPSKDPKYGSSSYRPKN